MKLYSNSKTSKGKKEGIGDNNCIITELSYKNKIIGTIGLYRISNHNKNDLGYRVVWKSDKTEVMGKIIEEDVMYSLVKGKDQKDEKCKCCGTSSNKHYPQCMFAN